MSEDDDILAAEFALGLLDGEERRRAKLRLRGDARFAAACASWTDHFMTFLAGRDADPPASLFRRIQNRIAANDTDGDRLGARRLRWWQAATFAASAAAVALGVISLGRVPEPPARGAVVHAAPPQVVAVLTGDRHAGVVTVGFDPASRRMMFAPSGLDVGDHSAELWVIPADQRPRSLGVIGASAPSARAEPSAPASFVTPDATLAISLEPRGGSPTGAPTGPVILSGKVVLL